MEGHLAGLIVGKLPDVDDQIVLLIDAELVHRRQLPLRGTTVLQPEIDCEGIGGQGAAYRQDRERNAPEEPAKYAAHAKLLC